MILSVIFFAAGSCCYNKQLNKDELQGNRELMVEVLMLNLLHHQNMVNVVRHCSAWLMS